MRARNGLELRRKNEIDRLTKVYGELLDDVQSPGPDDENLSDVLQAIRLLDPEHPILKDPHLAVAFTEQVRATMDAGDLTSAGIIMDLAAELVPGDPGLARLNNQLAARLEQERRDRLAMELRGRLER